ncbi:DUF6371 domain-containing protein [Flaviaesturariibacter amylovorans]|uniref:Uncharacterized protein n=1 Tax=Flaviaesturariibacter amylovorans TaxID=1084520 RepID=A0ABP8GPQ6_9BACT
MDHRYQLQKKTINCHVCGGKKSLKLYIDTATGLPLDETVGRCQRENKCGYHLKPREYFAQHPDSRPAFTPNIAPIAPEKCPVDLPGSILTPTLSNYARNSFVKALLPLYPAERIEKVVGDYLIGTTAAGLAEEAPDNLPAVFWFINAAGAIRAGQVKIFNEACKTVALQMGEHTLKAYWMHRVIKRQCKAKGEPLPEWYADYEAGEKVTCLYGAHLLKKYAGKPVAVVEAPKSAIIGALEYPGMVWVATTSLSYLTRERCRVLAGRRVHLFPDTGILNPRTGKTCWDLWSERAGELADLAEFHVERVLEDNTTPEQKEQGYDLADYILDRRRAQAGAVGIKSEELDRFTGSTAFPQFGGLILAHFLSKSGEWIEPLYDAEGMPATYGPQVQHLEAFSGKTFRQSAIDGAPCLIHQCN